MNLAQLCIFSTYHNHLPSSNSSSSLSLPPVHRHHRSLPPHRHRRRRLLLVVDARCRCRRQHQCLPLVVGITNTDATSLSSWTPDARHPRHHYHTLVVDTYSSRHQRQRQCLPPVVGTTSLLSWTTQTPLHSRRGCPTRQRSVTHTWAVRTSTTSSTTTSSRNSSIRTIRVHGLIISCFF